MSTVHGTLIFPDGRQMAGLMVGLDAFPHSWSGTLQIALNRRAEFNTALLQGTLLKLLFDDGRFGFIRLWDMEGRTWFEGLGPLRGIDAVTPTG